MGGDQGVQLANPGQPISDPPSREQVAVLVEQAQIMVGLTPVHPNKQHGVLLCSELLAVSQRRTRGAPMAVLTWHDIPPAIHPSRHRPGHGLLLWARLRRLRVSGRRTPDR